MKITLRLLSFLTLFAGILPALRAADDGPVFELRTYTATPGNLDKLLTRFRDHTLRIFEKHGMKNLGYAVPTDKADGAGEKLIYLIAHRSREAAKESWKNFSADPEWKDVSAKSQVGGKIVAKVDSIFLSAADFTPKVAEYNGQPRIFEMRTYTTPEGKIGALDARFRDHTCALFEKHGMTNLGYYHPIDADKGAGKTLIYFLAFPNREAATKSWAAFRADPVWVAAKAASEKAAGGSLTIPDGVKSVFMTPTDFSPTK
ncbi:MAG: NIPSNAP family protein [Verrucomicrobia bacterium]|nr:NIPSNAP family protein [Verrucomicrobiota bacterium]